MIGRLNYYLGQLLVILMAVMTLDVLWGVFTRYALGAQAGWTEELARFLLIWIGMLGTAYASGEGMHLSIDLLAPKLSATGRGRLQVFIVGMILFFAIAVMIVGGSRLMFVTATLGQRSAALGLPMAVVYAVVPISGLLICVFKLDQIRAAWK